MASSERQQLINKKELFISCVIPVFNEEANVTAFFSQLAGFLRNMTERFEIIAIDDGSADKTAQAILQLPEEHHIKLLKFSRNFGKEIALTAGLKHTSGQV